MGHPPAGANFTRPRLILTCIVVKPHPLLSALSRPIFLSTMHFNFVTVAAATGSLSASTMRLHGCPIEKNYSIASLPTALPAPTAPLCYVTAAVGTQNYTCSAAGNYTYVSQSPLSPSVQDLMIALQSGWSCC
jgi:hypothetical protein